MALALSDRVKETTTSTGTGSIALAGATTGYEAFSAALSNLDTTYYCIVDPSAGDWEVGVGTFLSSGPNLSRDTVLQSSNADALVNFAAGTKDVFITYPADKSVYKDASGNIVTTGDITCDLFTSAGIGDTSTTTQLTINNTDAVFENPVYFDDSGLTTSKQFSAGANTATEPILQFDSNDHIAYDRTANTFSFVIGSTVEGVIGTNSVDFQDSAVDTTGALTCAGFTSTGIDDNATSEMLQVADNSITLGGSSVTNVFRTENTNNLNIYGGTNASGGYITLYGASHSSSANDVQFGAGLNTELLYDDSASQWNFQANSITTTGSGTFADFTCTGITSTAPTGTVMTLTDSTVAFEDIIEIRERAADVASTAAYGQYWITTGNAVAGNAPAFTDDNNVAHQIETLLEKDITIETPDDADDLTWFYTNRAITVQELVGVIDAGTSVVLVVKHDTSRAAAGTTVDSITVSSTTTGTVETTISDATIPANSWVWIEVGTVTGAVTQVALHLEARIDV